MSQPPPVASPSRVGLRALVQGTLKCVVQAFTTTVHHVKKHAGVGIICAVAYFDPYVNLRWYYWTLRTDQMTSYSPEETGV